MKDLISVRDLAKEDIFEILRMADSYKEMDPTTFPTTQGRIASLFFENSTRTRVSSETAASSLGFSVNGFTGVEGTSVKKGEPLIDTVRMFQGYDYDAIVMRHNLAGAARLAADYLKIPVINGGDGSSSHPTQTLLDLYSINEAKGGIDGLNIALVGDLKYGRTVHSLLQALELFNSTVYLISPPNLAMPEWRIRDYEKTGKVVVVEHDLAKVLGVIDILYVTRIQRERFAEGVEGESEFKKVSNTFRITKKFLDKYASKDRDLKVLHPLPRDKNYIELHPDVDNTSYAYYFQQARNGLFVRQAIFELMIDDELLGRERNKKIPPNLQELPINNDNKNREKFIYRLDDGTLIDHIEPNQGRRICEMLGLDQLGEVVLCMNINSGKFNKKDVLAIHHQYLTSDQLYKLALISPKHTINIIKDRKIVNKQRAMLPSPLEDFITCSNPLCISRPEHNEFVKSIFYVESQDPLELRCHYCEQLYQQNELEF